MSGPVKDLFGEPNESACECGVIWRTPFWAQQCREEHQKKAARDRARAFARTGVSQFRKTEGSK